jgi:predicted HTH transcriptional regulator
MESEDDVNPLEKYLEKGEGEQVEFKQTLNNEFKIATTICSLANTRGGILLIGVKDDKTIAGVDPEEEKYFLLKAAEFHCRPPVPLKVEELFITDEYGGDQGEKVVLKVTIQKSSSKPHYAESKKGKWIAYLRQQDKTLIAGDQAVNIMEKDQDDDVSLTYTKNEERLLSYLQKNERITLKRYSDLVNISQRRARRELNDALGKGIIRILEHEKEDYYVI